MFEHRTSKPISVIAFAKRLLAHIAASAALIAISLVGGVVGYRLTESMPWTDAFLNASMILGGMGPVNMPVTFAGKIFAGCYALYSGLVFLIALAIVITPVFHRILHLFHVDESA